MYQDALLKSFAGAATLNGDMSALGSGGAWTTAGSPWIGDGIDIWSPGTVANQIGNGIPVKFWIQITEQTDSAADGELIQWQLVEADNAALTTNPVVLVETVAIAQAALYPGALFTLTVPPQRLTKQFIGIRAVVTGENITDGMVDAGIVLDEQTNRAGFAAENGR
jgi:hypothetical protein